MAEETAIRHTYKHSVESAVFSNIVRIIPFPQQLVTVWPGVEKMVDDTTPC